MAILGAIYLAVDLKSFFLLNSLKLMFYVAQSNLNNYGLKELIITAPGTQHSTLEPLKTLLIYRGGYSTGPALELDSPRYTHFEQPGG